MDIPSSSDGLTAWTRAAGGATPARWTGAPWNEARHSDSLAVDLTKKYMSDYKGNPFITIDLEDVEYKAYVKIDGNRQILIYPKNTKDVAVKIEDLNYKLSK